MLAFLAGLAVGTLVTAATSWVILRRRTEKLGRFFSFAAHEFNTPITAVNMTIINLLSGVFGEVREDQVRWVEMMREQVNRLNGMVGELRDLIHIQLAKDLTLSIEEVYPVEIVQDALASVRRGMIQAAIDVKVVLDDTVPKVHVDRDRAVRTLTSMMFHARKFRSTGGVTLETHQRGGQAFISLRYQGPALSARTVRDSLEVFYPAQKRNDLILGATGLGLGVLRAVSRSQGGDLDFSVDGGGQSVITLVLPTRRMIESTQHGH